MIRLVLIGVFLGTVLAAMGCGFECTVNGQQEQFNDCKALQTRFDAEQAKSPPDGKTLNDLNTCGSINNCDIKQ